MAPKARLNELDDQMRTASGAPVREQELRDAVRQLVGEAKKALPDGLPPGSPYVTLSTDEVVQEAARLGFRSAGTLTVDELRLVTEHLRVKMAAGPSRRLGELAPPTPMQTVPPVKIRGLKPSKSNTWRVEIPHGVEKKNVSVGGGQMAAMKNGAIIEARHYAPQVLQGLIDQGLKLVPIEDPETEE